MVSSVNGDVNEFGATSPNWLSQAVHTLDKVNLFSRWVNTIGVSVFFLMVCLTFIDVFMRYIFNRPILGSKEITELMLVLVVSLAIAYTYSERRHVSVEVVTSRLSAKARLVMDTVTTLISAVVFGIMVWRTSVQFLFFFNTHRIHGLAVGIPAAPFQSVIVLGCTLLFLLLLRSLLHNIAEGLRLRLRGYMWSLMFGIPVLLLVLAVFWMQSALWHLSLPVVGLIGVASSLVFMFMGMPVAFSLILTSFLFIGHIRGTTTALDIIGTEVFSTTSNYLWSVVAFFIIMGYFCLFARFGEDIYYSADKWFGHMSGGLAIATIGASTAFAGIVGDSLSVTTTMGTVALPQMRKYRYDDHLSTGTIAAGATIGPMIPPSMGFILYAILTEQSIGKLFIAGIIPGLLLAIVFTASIYLRCRRNPELGPPGQRATWGERMVSLKFGWPIAILFLLVIGGIYAGIFTATEGGGIGAAGAVIIGLAMKRFTWQNFNSALLGAGRTMGMIALILVGAMMFTRFVAWCNLAGVMREFMTGLALPSSVIILMILIIFLALGFVMDIMPLILIGVPIFHPVAMALGYDPVWFTVLLLLTIQVGVITPPFAVILFAIKGLAEDIPIGTIFRGVFPFVVGTVVVIGLIFVIPSLATWLPNLLY
jgi:tripartite ATP-independent transporter DctM subunit